MGKQLKGGRWAVDQDGVDALAEQDTYRNAGTAAVARAVPREPVDDERMSEEWNRARNQEGEVVGFIGQKPIVRPVRETVDKPVDKPIDKDSRDEGSESNSGIMAALARLRQQGQDE